MTENSQNPDSDQSPNSLTDTAPPSANESQNNGEADNEGQEPGNHVASAEPAPADASFSQNALSGVGVQPGPGLGRRRRRRRRRGRGAPVFFTPDGQAYRLQAGPDGQQSQVFLTPQELQSYQARAAQLPPTGQGAPRPGPLAPGSPAQVPMAQPQLAPVEGVLDTESKGPNAFLRQIRKNLLPTPEDPEIPKNLVQKLRLRQGEYLTAQALMRGNKGTIQKVDTVDGSPLEEIARRPHFNDLTSVDPFERLKLEHSPREMVTRVLDL